MPHPASIVVILNTSAGSAARHPHIGEELRELFHAVGCDARLVELAPGQDPVAAARAALSSAAIVVAGGGDGTVSAVARGLIDSQAVLGILPLGTLNHFAKDLRIPLDIREAVAVIAAGKRAHVDVGDVNGHVFINNCSLGVYPDIVQERDRLRDEGHRKWPATAIATFRVLRRYRGVTVRVDVDDRQKEWRTPIVLIGNNEYAIDGVRLGSRAAIDRGTLSVYVAPRAHARDLPILFVSALFGRARQSGTFENLAATDLIIDAHRARGIRIAVDGEVIRLMTPLRFRTRPRALQVMVPQV